MKILECLLKNILGNDKVSLPKKKKVIITFYTFTALYSGLFLPVNYIFNYNLMKTLCHFRFF